MFRAESFVEESRGVRGFGGPVAAPPPFNHILRDGSNYFPAAAWILLVASQHSTTRVTRISDINEDSARPCQCQDQ